MSEDNEPKKKPRGRPFQIGNKFGSISKKNRKKLSLSDYIKKKTNDGKMLTDLYTGVLKAVEDSDAESMPMYKGMKVTVELSNKAVDWLGKNGWGTPSQRKDDVKEPELSREEIEARIKALNEKMGVVTITLEEYESLKKSAEVKVDV